MYQDDKVSFGVQRACYADSYFLADTETDALNAVYTAAAYIQ